MSDTTRRLVYVVDDDDAVRDALSMLFRTAGLEVESYPSATVFLESCRPETPSCLVLDIRMPGMPGPVLQDELLQREIRIPIVFVTGHGDVPMAVAAIKKGAYDFVEKPFDEGYLLGQVLAALEQPNTSPAPTIGQREKLRLLSDRERDVLERVLEAKPSRRIAEELFITMKTVDFHRANIMRKLGVRSAAELFRLFLAPKPSPAAAKARMSPKN